MIGERIFKNLEMYQKLYRSWNISQALGEENREALRREISVKISRSLPRRLRTLKQPTKEEK